MYVICKKQIQNIKEHDQDDMFKVLLDLPEKLYVEVSIFIHEKKYKNI